MPLDRKFVTEGTSVQVGKVCDKGHRWMCSKTIADCVEALIGAYYVGGGLNAALPLMKWLGIDAEFEPTLVEEAINSASIWSYSPKVDELKTLESKLDYSFTVKGLLLEAITHASMQELGVSCCYQVMICRSVRMGNLLEFSYFCFLGSLKSENLRYIYNH